jgi:hypothetical protein
MDDTDLDEVKCFFLSLLPSFRQFNDEQKFLAQMEIQKIMRHVKIWIHTHLAPCLPFQMQSHFTSNPLNSQPVTCMQNSEILSRYLSNYSVQPQRPPTFTAVLPQYHTSPSPISSNAPLPPGEDGSNEVSSLLFVGSTAHL